MFEGFLFDSEQVCSKAEEEAHLWYAAQSLETRSMDDHRDQSFQVSSGWKHPPGNFVKCNIGVQWVKKRSIAGAAWVLRDDICTVLLHSRRSFGEVHSKDDAQFLSVVWAMESIETHRFLKVHFAFEERMFVDAINRPPAWFSFKLKVQEFRKVLRNFLECKVMVEPYDTNRGARLIAFSAVMDRRFQSYVARGQSSWCVHVF